jgi:peptidyl-prolyl cis-trans isomerase SurA
MIKQRAFVLGLVFLAQSMAFLPAASAQGLRVSPQLGGGPAAARESGPRAADYIVAVVNSEPITNNEVRSRMIRFEQQLAQQGASMPPRAELARQVLERLISEKAQLQLARETGVKIDEATLDQAEQNVARQNQIEVSELRRRIVADGGTPAQFREDLRNQLLLTRLRDRELDAKVRVSDLELDQYIREQQGSTDASALEMNLAHLLVAVPEGATPQQVAALQAKAQQLQVRAAAGEDFTKLVREYSQAPGAAASGGVVGLRTADRYPPLFVEATDKLREGGVSEVVRSGAGFHIIKVIEKRQGGLPGADVVQSHARHILLRPSAQLSEAQAVAKLADFRKRILAGQADFAQLAKENSQDASAPKGGDLGWANPGLFVPEFENTLNAMSPGQISEPLVSRFGVHLIQLLERRQQTLSQREQRDLARNVLREKKLDEAYASWAHDVRGRAYVEYRDPPQ